MESTARVPGLLHAARGHVGAKRYTHRTGTFTDHVFVGFGAPTGGVGGIVDYEQLLVVIAPDKGQD